MATSCDYICSRRCDDVLTQPRSCTFGSSTVPYYHHLGILSGKERSETWRKRVARGTCGLLTAAVSIRIHNTVASWSKIRNWHKGLWKYIDTFYSNHTHENRGQCCLKIKNGKELLLKWHFFKTYSWMFCLILILSAIKLQSDWVSD